MPKRGKIDLGTIERRQQGDVVVTSRRVVPGGIIEGQGARVEHAWLIEMLYSKGLLGEGNEARRRREAGEWLTALYGRVRRSEGVSGYSILSTSGHDMSDEEADDWRIYNDYLRAMPYGVRCTLMYVCQRHIYPTVQPETVQQCLDKLADWRGIG